MKDIRTYENRTNIRLLEFKVKTTLFCPLGSNYYFADVNVKMELDKRIADFIDVERYFKKDVNGMSLTVEEAVDKFYNDLSLVYQPKQIEISLSSYSHFDLTVTKGEVK